MEQEIKAAYNAFVKLMYKAEREGFVIFDQDGDIFFYPDDVYVEKRIDKNT